MSQATEMSIRIHFDKKDVPQNFFPIDRFEHKLIEDKLNKVELRSFRSRNTQRDGSVSITLSCDDFTQAKRRKGTLDLIALM